MNPTHKVNMASKKTKNIIIENWEYLDDFLAKYIKANTDYNKNQSSIPTLNIIREKLWHYFYKMHIKGGAKAEPITS